MQTLSLSKQKLLKFTTGHVFDLISNDIKRVEEDFITRFFHFPFAILECVATLFLLDYLIGWQAVIGVIFLLVLLPYFASLSHVNAVLRLRTAAMSDLRISLMNQVICGIRSIKMHAWEDAYGAKIGDFRR